MIYFNYDWSKYENIIANSCYNQTNLAELLGISQARLNNYILDKREPDFAFIVKFCKFFKITPNDLFGFESTINYNNIYDNTAKVVKVVDDFINLHKIKMDSDSKAQLVAGLTVKLLSTPKEKQDSVISCVLEWEAGKRAVV